MNIVEISTLTFPLKYRVNEHTNQKIDSQKTFKILLLLVFFFFNKFYF